MHSQTFFKERPHFLPLVTIEKRKRDICSLKGSTVVPDTCIQGLCIYSNFFTCIVMMTCILTGGKDKAQKHLELDRNAVNLQLMIDLASCCLMWRLIWFMATFNSKAVKYSARHNNLITKCNFSFTVALLSPTAPCWMCNITNNDNNNSKINNFFPIYTFFSMVIFHLNKSTNTTV